MPQTNKSVNGCGAQLEASAPDQGEPPPPQEQVAAWDGGQRVPTEDQGDLDIIKSPSDPKKYRWETETVSYTFYLRIFIYAVSAIVYSLLIYYNKYCFKYFVEQFGTSSPYAVVAVTCRTEKQCSHNGSE